MKKINILLTIGIIILIILIAFVGSVIAKQRKNSAATASIKLVVSLEENNKEVVIDQKEDITKFNDYLKSVREAEIVDLKLALLNDVVIEFENNESIVIQTTVDEYCYYINNEQTKLVKMPEGLLNKVKEYI